MILASASPRRRELLERFWGTDHLAVLVPDYDEKAALEAFQRERSYDGHKFQKLTARDLAGLLPAGKLGALQTQFQLPAKYVAIAADTMVVLDNQIMGKPADQDEAARMLRQLSGRTHEVLTGISLIAGWQDDVLELKAIESTAVRFAEISDAQINWYINTAEPMDKAGSYGIQGFGAALVERIDGCYYNVMGLPVNRLMVMLQTVADHFSLNSSFNHLLPWF